MRIFFQFYTFNKISNYHSHAKTTIIIFIVMLILRKAKREHVSLGLYLFKKQINKPLRIIRTFINSMNWLSAQWNNVAELSLNRKNKESNILRFDFSTFANIKILRILSVAQARSLLLLYKTQPIS